MKQKSSRRIGLATGAALFTITVSAGAAEELSYSPNVGTDFPKNVYFGDLHMHTSNSPDAYGQGNVELRPDDAFNYAKGEELTAYNGMKVRLRRPLDFLAITDHSEFLGITYRLVRRDSALLATEWGQKAGEWTKEEAIAQVGKGFTAGILTPDNFIGQVDEPYRQSVWNSVVDNADRHNEPGKFTAFAAYEFTSMIDGNNLHRCIILEDGADVAKQLLPFSSHDSTDPEDLWAALAAYEQKSGGTAISIPHNSNISGGMMFDEKTLSGDPIDRAYAETRMRWEPVHEMTQVKGDSETHPYLSPTDEFADYERWDKYNIMGNHELTPDQFPGSYARSALKRGLEIEAKTGANPYAFGMIGSSDIHNTYVTFREDNFFGKFPSSEPDAHRFDHKMAGGKWSNWRLTASGLAAVWAEENTREALMAALKRREVYATTGSRIMVRFFGGWRYEDGDVGRWDYVRRGYAGGVPMGGDLTEAPGNKAPIFMVVAAKDPEDANLDRIQIVKGWLDADGKAQEKVYDVAFSGGRLIDAETGKAPSVGNTVDVDDASYTNTIGDAQLSAQWTDPDFDPSQPAFYYARVIEIPKPRWTAYDAKYFGTQMPEEVPMKLQDRAYTSPIWYRP
jgi:hypothetical protein